MKLLSPMGMRSKRWSSATRLSESFHLETIIPEFFPHQKPSDLLPEMIDGAGLRVPCTNGAEHHHAAALHLELAANHAR
jgi:hypothetical protein